MTSFEVVKRHKRLWIVNDAGEGVYTPPNFLKLHSREPLKALARYFSIVQTRSIGLIAEFEARHTPRKRPCLD